MKNHKSPSVDYVPPKINAGNPVSKGDVKKESVKGFSEIKKSLVFAPSMKQDDLVNSANKKALSGHKHYEHQSNMRSSGGKHSVDLGHGENWK